MKLLAWICLIGTIIFTSCEENKKTETEQKETSTIPALTQAEKAAGWKLLFDGKTTKGWHTYLKESVEGWEVKDGELITKGGSGDIVTDEVFENFELELEWRISEKGNSGIIYLVDEKPENHATHVSGPEYQIIDDKNYPDKLGPAQHSGANYAVHAPIISASKPVGEFNTAKIIVIKGRVEHWLNDKKVVAYTLGSPEWQARVDTTKFADVPTYGRSQRGRIALQDHNNEVAFRNIRIRERE